MVQEIKLKVSMHSEKCKKEVLKTVTKLAHIDEVTVDLKKEQLIVVGDVDPVCVAKCLRKKRKVVEIVSVGPHKKEKDITDKQQFPIVYYNHNPYNYQYGQIYEYPLARDGGGCNIL
uniref:heavy metal-associated isoprenylated plant protein 2-like n=1 Tax=Erigeron canadensis TaxID=72917 RepID=UPI001CB93C75|nr:heavy metal-associated isoprenylated plant protein 2-like [Erigeron canadensis]